MTAARLLALVSAALASMFLFGHAATAQQPRLTLKCTTGNTAVNVGGSIPVNCTLLDPSGSPPRESDSITFVLYYEAGTNAAYEAGGKTKIVPVDAQGRGNAVLKVGDKPGSLGILVTHPTIYSQAFSVQVTAPPTPVPAAPAPIAPEPIVAESSSPLAANPALLPIVRPPNTGDGGLASQ